MVEVLYIDCYFFPYWNKEFNVQTEFFYLKKKQSKKIVVSWKNAKKNSMHALSLDASNKSISFVEWCPFKWRLIRCSDSWMLTQTTSISATILHLITGFIAVFESCFYSNEIFCIRRELRFHFLENERANERKKSFCWVRNKMQLNGFPKRLPIFGNNKTAK